MCADVSVGKAPWDLHRGATTQRELRELSMDITTLPAAGITRDLALQRLTEECAAEQATAALAAAVARARASSGPLADVLAAYGASASPECDTPAERERRGAAASASAFL